MTDARFDPRYDAAFQPGFPAGDDPSTGGATRGRRARPSEQSAPSAAAPNSEIAAALSAYLTPGDEAAAPGAPAGTLAAARAGSGAAPAAAAYASSLSRPSALNPTPADDWPEAAAPAADSVVRARRPVSPWRNPWLLVLTILGIVLVVGGVAGHAWAVGITMNAYTERAKTVDFAVVQMMWTFGPLVACVGAGTLIGVLFFVAYWLSRGRYGAAPTDAPSAEHPAEDVAETSPAPGAPSPAAP